jgi:hypothetical protein
MVGNEWPRLSRDVAPTPALPSVLGARLLPGPILGVGARPDVLERQPVDLVVRKLVEVERLVTEPAELIVEMVPRRTSAPRHSRSARAAELGSRRHQSRGTRSSAPTNRIRRRAIRPSFARSTASSRPRLPKGESPCEARALGPETESNCVAARRGGEQLEVSAGP